MMKIRQYSVLDASGFERSCYSKELLIDSDNGIVYWGYPVKGHLIKKSCIWIQIGDTYYSYIVESSINTTNDADINELKGECNKLLKILVNSKKNDKTSN